MSLPSFSVLPLLLTVFLSSVLLAVSIVDASGVSYVYTSVLFGLCVVLFCFL